MRFSSALVFGFVPFAIAQTTVTICESYSITGTITFTEYTTFYETNDGLGASRSSTRSSSRTLSSSTTTASLIIGDPSTTLLPSSQTTSAVSSSFSRTTGVVSTSSSTVSRSVSTTSSSTTTQAGTTSVTMQPSTTLTTATSTTGSTTTTTSPEPTEPQFYIVFNTPVQPNRRLIRRATLYLTFNAEDQSIVTSDQTAATQFYIDENGFTKTGPNFVLIDDTVSPPRLTIQPVRPAEPLRVQISNGAVSIEGIDAYCLEADNDLSLVTPDDGSAEVSCQSINPQLVPATSTSSTTSTTTSSMSTTSEITTSSATSDAATSSTTSDSISSTISTTTASTTTSGPIITNKAYIDTVIRHHNVHRANHSAPSMTWDPSLAETARKIAETCVYKHNTTADCPPDANGDFYACYGQNIGAGYTSLQMGAIISEGFYNGEEPYYTYYGTEPDINTIQATLHQWGHFSQIVWVGSSRVGCYTTDCTDRPGQLGNIDSAATRIRPIFTVCNYGDPGNYVGEFKDNVLAPRGDDSVYADYLCPSDENCEDEG